MYYLLILTFAVCCRSSVCEVKFVEHLDVQEHKIRKRESITTPIMEPEQSTTATYSDGMTPPTKNKTLTDNHDYYTSKVVHDPHSMYWNELENDTRHHLSNAKYLRYSIIHLSFNFTFYGHFIDTFAITTQGFLYMSSFHHPKLDYTHSRYIAPLMANFDTIGNDSDILYRDYGDRCVIEWRNVQLNNQSENGNYTFQTTLFENGTILFSYKSISETNISDREWPVKVGIADSYYYDIGRWRYIVRYHIVEKNVTVLMDNMAIILDPLPTCNTASSCDECTELKSGFNCTWCDSVSRCSDGFDRHRQEWLEANCSVKAVNSSDMCTMTSMTTTVTPGTKILVYNEKPQNEGQTTQKDSTKTLQIVIPIVVICSVLLILVGVWVVYAYRHPSTASGQWLIENRPSQIKRKISDKFSNICFSKDSETSDNVQFS